jgi:transcriptional regulator with XRE-family HTH domain
VRFGAALKRLRVAKRISQRELAKKTGIDRGDIIDYEKGRVWPQARSLVRLLDALDATADDLFPGPEGERRRPTVASYAGAAIAEPIRPRADADEISDPLRDDWGAEEVLRVRIKDVEIEIPIGRLTLNRSAGRTDTDQPSER